MPISFFKLSFLWISWFPRLHFYGYCRNLKITITCAAGLVLTICHSCTAWGMCCLFRSSTDEFNLRVASLLEEKKLEKTSASNEKTFKEERNESSQLKSDVWTFLYLVSYVICHLGIISLDLTNTLHFIGFNFSCTFDELIFVVTLLYMAVSSTVTLKSAKFYIFRLILLCLWTSNLVWNHLTASLVYYQKQQWLAV